ncbi:MAG: hypothetical protein U0229_20735 [Anaeromyxobacter sp.]
MHTSRAVLAGVLLLAAQSCATANDELTFIRTTVKLDGETCKAFGGEIWVINWDYDHVVAPGSEAFVKSHYDIHVVIRDSGQAARLVEQLERIPTHVCGDKVRCDEMDLTFVAHFSGTNGCERTFVADRTNLVNVATRRVGHLGNALDGMFAFKAGSTCLADDAALQLMSAAWNKGIPPTTKLVRTALVGPVTWAQFQKDKPSLPESLEKDAPGLVGTRRFYYARWQWGPVEYGNHETGTVEGFVTEDDCEAVKVHLGGPPP